MKTGDKVLVEYDDGDKVKGTLVDANVTIRTDRGGLMNGMVGSIEELQDLIDTKNDKPPVVYPEAKHDCT